MSINLDGYKALKPFRFWCQKVLPAVYDDSLSYYEVLGKLVSGLNTLIDNVEVLHSVVGQDHTDVEEIKEGFELLRNSIAAIIAPNFVDDGYYAAGTYVIYENHLYQFRSTHEGLWTGEDVWSTSVNLELYHLYSSIAELFNPYTSYNPGDYVIYGGELYRFFAAYSGDWNTSVVQKKSITDVLKELNTRDDGLNELLRLMNEAVELNTEDIDTLDGKIDEAVDQLDREISATISQFADTYDSTHSYTNGDIVIYQGDLYQMTASGTTTGNFDTTKWTKRTVADLIYNSGSGSSLPAVSTNDNLKTLKVVNGAWAVEHGFDTIVIAGNETTLNNQAFKTALWNSVIGHITLIKLNANIGTGVSLPVFFIRLDNGVTNTLYGLAWKIHSDNYNHLIIDKWYVTGGSETNIVFTETESFVLLPKASGTDAGKSLLVNAHGDWHIDSDVLHVTFTMTQTGANSFTSSCDKTYSQIKNAIDAGKTIDCKILFNGMLFEDQTNMPYTLVNPVIMDFPAGADYGGSISFRYLWYNASGTLQYVIFGDIGDDDQVQCSRTVVGG